MSYTLPASSLASHGGDTPTLADPSELHAFADEALLLLHDVDAALWSTNQAQNAGAHLQAVNAALRHLHSIKGGAAALGLMHLAELAHASEGVLVRSRQALRDAALASTAAGLQAARSAAAHAVPVPLLLSATATLRLGLPLQGQEPRQVPLSLIHALEQAAGLNPKDLAQEAEASGGHHSYELVLSNDVAASATRDIEALFVDLPDLGTLTPLLAMPGAGHLETDGRAAPRRYLVHSASSVPELLSLVHLHCEAEQVQLHAWEATSPAQPGASLIGAANATPALPSGCGPAPAAAASPSQPSLAATQSARAATGVPAAALLKPFKREVARLAQQLGKAVALRLVGADIEVPSHWLATLTPILRHLVRNACDHGLEPPAQRVALGKAPEGQLTLEVLDSRAHWLVRVSDDGKGLDRQALLHQAQAMGVEVNSKGSDQQIWALAFEPGLSTAATLSDVSGRGVGLDAVRHQVEQLGGQVQLHAQPGQGCAVTLRLPKPQAQVSS